MCRVAFAASLCLLVVLSLTQAVGAAAQHASCLDPPPSTRTLAATCAQIAASTGLRLGPPQGPAEASASAVGGAGKGALVGLGVGVTAGLIAALVFGPGCEEGHAGCTAGLVVGGAALGAGIGAIVGALTGKGLTRTRLLRPGCDVRCASSEGPKNLDWARQPSFMAFDRTKAYLSAGTLFAPAACFASSFAFPASPLFRYAVASV